MEPMEPMEPITTRIPDKGERGMGKPGGTAEWTEA